MFGFLIRLAIAVPLFAALLALSVLALVIEVVSPSAGQRPCAFDVIGNYLHRG